jgi:hypothetical protein
MSARDKPPLSPADALRESADRFERLRQENEDAASPLSSGRFFRNLIERSSGKGGS